MSKQKHSYESNAKALFLLLAFTLIVLTANILNWHFQNKSLLLRATIIIIGLLYLVGVPVGLWKHWKLFGSIIWNEDGLGWNPYFRKNDRTWIEWQNVRRIEYSSSSLITDDVKKALQSLEVIGKRKRQRFIRYSLTIFGPQGKAVSIDHRMLSVKQIANILNALDTNFPTTSC